MPRIDRTEGRSLFGLDPEAYDRARPDYPDRIYDILRERCGLSPTTKVLEIGPGSGTATRRLLALGVSDIVAIEPDESLAAYLSSNSSRIDVRVEPFEDADLVPASFDLAIAATTFHWIDQQTGLRKVRHVLGPGGWWAMWWNSFFDPELDDPFHDATSHLLSSLAESPSQGEPDRPPFALDVEAREAGLAAAGFTSISHDLVHWTLTMDAARTRALYATYGSISRLAAEERERLLDEIAHVADKQFGGNVNRNMITSLYTARKPD
jgi:SAM-dependent methyltransferase